LRRCTIGDAAITARLVASSQSFDQTSTETPIASHGSSAAGHVDGFQIVTMTVGSTMAMRASSADSTARSMTDAEAGKIARAMGAMAAMASAGVIPTTLASARS